MGRSKQAKGSGQKAAGPESGPGLPTAVWSAGLALLLIAASAALMLSIREVAANFNLPGCGPQSGCADIKNAEVFGVKIGMVPVIDWPVSYVGFAFFVAMGLAWMLSWRSGPSRVVTGMTFVGGLVSVLFLAAMAIAQKFCVYCFAAHVANLLFVALVAAWMFTAARPSGKGDRPRAAAGRAPVVAGLAAFVLSAAAFGVAHETAAGKAEADHAEKRAESRREIIEQSHARAAVESNPDVPEQIDVRPEETGETANAGSPPAKERFAGRWEMGPAKAPIRIVVFSDYQCHLCRATEQLLMEEVQRSDDIWISVKHYPWCQDCNKYVPNTPHPNACFAARAAETAGAIGGPEAFWKMHQWLFNRQGRFETAQILQQGIAAAGITDVAGFMAYFNDESRSLANVTADIEEAQALGVTQTPMVFINGVELRGMSRVSQLKSEIDALRAENLPALTAAADRPPTAVEKYVQMWAEGRDFTPDDTLTVTEADWSMGATAPEVDIVVWADYKFAGVPEVDRAMRELIEEYDWARYTFRFYPLDRGCNEYLPERPLLLEGACRAAQIAEAAGQVAGEEGFWKMHAWLMENPERSLGDFMAKFAAGKVGLDGDAIIAAADTPDIWSAIADDAMRKQALDPNARMPLIIVGGKVVPTNRTEVIKEVVRGAMLQSRGKTN